MAVPSSGTITMLGIAQERLYGTYGGGSVGNPILSNDLVNGGGFNSFPALNSNSPTLPSTSNPLLLNAWYEYDQDATSGCTGFLTNTNPRNACNISSSNTSYYHDGSGLYPVTGDKVYSDFDCTNLASGGTRRVFSSSGTGLGTYTVQFAFPNNGVVTGISIC